MRRGSNPGQAPGPAFPTVTIEIGLHLVYIHSWTELETKFHEYFSDGSLEFRISDLISVQKKINEPVGNYLRRFREIRNRCYSVALPDAQLADLAF